MNKEIEQIMEFLSTGKPPTLANWRELAAREFGANSPATVLLDYKIEAFGADDQCPADEQSGLEVLRKIHLERSAL